MALFKNTAGLTIGFNVNSPVPMDCRAVLDYRTDLINKSTWSGLGNPLYTGLVSYVKEDQSLYILTSSSPVAGLVNLAEASETEKANAYKMWTKLATSSSLESLSGVFKFKGVAESINEAQTILTLSSATATKGSNTYTVKCQTIGYEYDMDIYYGWGVTSDSILFWTDTPTLTSTSTQYSATLQTTVKKLVLNGEDYYIADRTVPAGDGLSQWENISGKVVYCNETTSKVYSEDQEDPEYELGVAEIVTYEAYDFAPLVASDKYTVSNIASADVATEGTTGHVYQIEENEYASNGTIWVKLGAPTENWIVL